MTEATRRWSWRSWLPDITAAVSRFPLGVLLAGTIARELGPRGAILVMAILGLAATLALVVALRRR